MNKRYRMPKGMSQNHRVQIDLEAVKPRPGSRRNSSSLSRRNSIKKEREGIKKSPMSSSSSSSTSTPKKVVNKPAPEFIVTGKQILKRSDRANSLPGSYQRRPSASTPKRSNKRDYNVSHCSKSRHISLEEDMSLDLSLVLDLEERNSKCVMAHKFHALATSTPRPGDAMLKMRSGSLQSQQKTEPSRRLQKMSESKQSVDSTFSCSRDSLYKTSSSTSHFRNAPSTELDYSFVSPEYSGQSSVDASPRGGGGGGGGWGSQHHVSASHVHSSSSQECSESLEHSQVQELRNCGEWNNFWANYNNSIAKVPMKNYYDQCPTPYRTETIDFADLDISDGSRKPSPEAKHINYIIRNEGLHLTPRETQNMIKCAHILGNVLSKAIKRRSNEKDSTLNVQEVKLDPEIEIKRKTLTLDLRETNTPLEVQEEKRSETVTTQTDISLPNTKSAPKIFENILRQLSRSSIDDSSGNKLTVRNVPKVEINEKADDDILPNEKDIVK